MRSVLMLSMLMMLGFSTVGCGGGGSEDLSTANNGVAPTPPTVENPSIISMDSINTLRIGQTPSKRKLLLYQANSSLSQFAKQQDLLKRLRDFDTGAGCQTIDDSLVYVV